MISDHVIRFFLHGVCQLVPACDIIKISFMTLHSRHPTNLVVHILHKAAVILNLWREILFESTVQSCQKSESCGIVTNTGTGVLIFCKTICLFGRKHRIQLTNACFILAFNRFKHSIFNSLPVHDLYCIQKGRSQSSMSNFRECCFYCH